MVKYFDAAMIGYFDRIDVVCDVGELTLWHNPAVELLKLVTQGFSMLAFKQPDEMSSCK